MKIGKCVVLCNKTGWSKTSFGYAAFLYCYKSGGIDLGDGKTLEENIHHNPYGPSYHHAFDKYTEYRIHDIFHRLDGPALIDGNTNKFYIAGTEYTELEYLVRVSELEATFPNNFILNGVEYCELDWWTPITR